MIRELIPKLIRKQLYRLLFPNSPVLWANWGKLSEYLAKKIQPMQPPIVILSMPRSGSSWVGEILGLAPNGLYFREPLTIEYLKSNPNRPSFFELDINNIPESYSIAAKKSFTGFPLFNSTVVRFPKQWSLLDRSQKRVVIKEVNPLMGSWLKQVYHPKIIYLVRHPAAVSYSFERMGWRGKQFEFRFSQTTLQEKIPNYKQYTHSFWSEHGAIQAFLQNQILSMLSNYENFKIVKYEDICSDPMSVYKELYEFAELKWTNIVEKKILERTQPAEINGHNFSVYRNTSYEMNKWKKEVAIEKIIELKNAYLSFDPAYYQADWPE